MFKNRKEAGERLLDSLQGSAREADRVVTVSLSSRRIAENISSELNIPLDSLASRYLRVPGRPELRFGAVAEDGTIWIDDAMVDEFGIDRDRIKSIVNHENRRLVKEVENHGLQGIPDVKSEKVLFVTDGVPSGMRIAASLGSATKKGAGRKFVATPFISEHAHGIVSRLLDGLNYLEKPQFVLSVNEGYYSNETLHKRA